MAFVPYFTNVRHALRKSKVHITYKKSKPFIFVDYALHKQNNRVKYLDIRSTTLSSTEERV